MIAAIGAAVVSAGASLYVANVQIASTTEQAQAEFHRTENLKAYTDFYTVVRTAARTGTEIIRKLSDRPTPETEIDGLSDGINLEQLPEVDKALTGILLLAPDTVRFHANAVHLALRDVVDLLNVRINHRNNATYGPTESGAFAESFPAAVGSLNSKLADMSDAMRADLK